MPTGYTTGIIDGTINTFPDFAKICMRAMGATIMMRDEPLSAPWKPRKPTEYHAQEIGRRKEAIIKCNQQTDEQVVSDEKDRLQDERKYHIESIQKAVDAKKKLDELMNEAKLYQPPTEKHQKVKDFMIQQLKETIESDTDTEYHQESIRLIDSELTTITADSVRSKIIEKANEAIKYHTHQQEEEIKRCVESNEWVETFLSSL